MRPGKLFSFITFIFLSLNYACLSQKNEPALGIAICKTFLYDTINHSYYDAENFFPSVKIWFKDSLVIEQLKTITLRQKDVTHKDARITTLCYVFIDLKKNKRQAYQNFSDTAAAYKVPHYKTDSLGWEFWKYNDLQMNDSLTAMPDTTILAVRYTRAKIRHWKPKSGNPLKFFDIITYADCDKKKRLINLTRIISEKIGCPVVMWERVVDENNNTYYKRVLEYVSEKLSDEELKVFAAWEANMK